MGVATFTSTCGVYTEFHNHSFMIVIRHACMPKTYRACWNVFYDHTVNGYVRAQRDVEAAAQQHHNYCKKYAHDMSCTSFVART